ncbi:MAG: hypothetical protein COV48_01535 [Elusimicrobia bacterium CG11_big_fil_rev_8_21_14_0_20_64_6]|nr:MAG: hypothetical protein COV48_01535 [Elusimicrobia bacterium CG11_big_fil_rev_8_21_14_0_20_64_6]
MAWRRPPAAWYPVLIAGAFLAVRLGLQAEARMVIYPVDGQMLYGQDSDDDELASGGESSGGESSGGGPKTYQRIRKTGGVRAAVYGFQNFNRDKIEISYQIPENVFRPYNDSFGYTKQGLNEVKAWRENARQSAFKLAVKQSKSQSQLDHAIASLDKEYDKRVKDYLADHGFRMMKGNIVTVDMPGLVRKNSQLIKPLSLSFEKIANSKRYRSGDIIGSVLSFVQTAMYYKQPDPVFKDKHTGGVLPPITAVLVGWGDCDTKTGLLASVLSNWGQMKMVGVGVPGHYLMGVLLIPEKGDLFLEYKGLQYVLVEPAGPAWLPPGQVGEETMQLLNGREGYKIEAFY